MQFTMHYPVTNGPRTEILSIYNLMHRYSRVECRWKIMEIKFIFIILFVRRQIIFYYSLYGCGIHLN